MHFLPKAALLLALAVSAGLSSSAEPALSTNVPIIELARDGSQTRLLFTGKLQIAESLDGAWTDLTNATSPYILDLAGGQKFFRTRDVASIFSSEAIINFVVTGPLQEHFDLAFAGLPDGIFPPVREKPWFNGSILIGEQTLPAELRVRGNSSLQECPFPKLKFKVSRTDRAGTPFFDAREVKIGTHCAEGGRGSIGRLRDERAAYREALVYETMQILGFVSPRVRRARIEYHDSTPPTTNRTSEVGWTVMRNAMILDDVEVVAERLGGRALDDEEITVLSNANFGLQLVTDLQFFHILLGNWDYGVSVDGRELWNTEVIEFPDGSFLPVAGDFDLCSFVTEEPQLDVPWDYHPELPPLERQARHDLEEIKGRVSEENPAVFTQARERFTARRTEIETKINSVIIDEIGRTNALAHVNAFFNALSAVDPDRK